MTTIKRKISRPYLLIIIASPIIIIVLFNLLVTYYNRHQAEVDLLAAVDSVSDSIASGDLTTLVSVMKNQDHTTSAEVIVYNQQGELSSVFNQYSTFVDEELAAIAYTEISDLAEDEIGIFKHQGQTYYVVAVAYINQSDTTTEESTTEESTTEESTAEDDTATDSPLTIEKPSIGSGTVTPNKSSTEDSSEVDDQEDDIDVNQMTNHQQIIADKKVASEDSTNTAQAELTASEMTPITGSMMSTSNVLVYISKGLTIDEFVHAINLFLLIVSAVVTLLGIFVSSRISRAVARPIERLTTLVENMKSDEVIVIMEQSDCLEINKLSNEINVLSKRLYHFDQSQKKFLHNASHELRTPLMSIQGYADGIEMGVFEDAKGTAHLISDQSKRLTKLVDSLLTLARTENFNANRQLEPVNLSHELLDLINGYQGYAMSQNVAIELDLQPDITVMGNAELLAGSVGNIIANGIRYATSTLVVSLTAKDQTATITIRDDGKGIEHIDTIFERFSKGEQGNFGLGLSIAKTSIEMMNGQIDVYNDQGAVFKITLILND